MRGRVESRKPHFIDDCIINSIILGEVSPDNFVKRRNLRSEVSKKSCDVPIESAAPPTRKISEICEVDIRKSIIACGGSHLQEKALSSLYEQLLPTFRPTVYHTSILYYILMAF